MTLHNIMGVAALTLCAGVASAADIKIKDFHAYGAGAVATPSADGMAKFKFNAVEGSTRFNLHVQDLAPNTTYTVVIRAADEPDPFAPQISPDVAFPLCLTTNSSGNGHFESVIQTFAAAPGMQVVVVSASYDALNLPPVALEEAYSIGTIAP